MPYLELLKIHRVYYLFFLYLTSPFWINSNTSWLFTLSSLPCNRKSKITRQACLIILLFGIWFYAGIAFGCPMASTLSHHYWRSSILHQWEGTWESRKLWHVWGKTLFGPLCTTTFNSSLFLALTVNIPNMKHENQWDYYVLYQPRRDHGKTFHWTLLWVFPLIMLVVVDRFWKGIHLGMLTLNFMA